jgi:hypothetical protein
MNNDAIQSAPFGASLAQGVAAALRAASVLLAHVRETIGRSAVARNREDVAAMNAYMRRDIGVDGSIGPHASAHRDLQYPRL